MFVDKPLIHKRFVLRTLFLCVLLATPLAMAGCVNLGDVREFANESAQLTGYKELTESRAKLYELERSFADPSSESCNAAALAKVNADRTAKTPVLLGYHETMSAYMAALAALAGESAYDFTKEIGDVADAVAKLPDTGVGADQLAAAKSLATLATNWALQGRQQATLKEVTSEADPHVQVFLEGMGLLIQVQKNDIKISRGCVVSFLKNNGIRAGRSGNKLLSVMALDSAAEKEAYYEQLMGAAAKARAGLQAVAKGHAELTRNAEGWDKEDLKIFLDEIKNIKEARKALETLGAL